MRWRRLPKRTHADRGYLRHAHAAALAATDCSPEVVRFLAYTGLRWGEIAALRVCDFGMLRRRVNVSRSVTESGGLVCGTPRTWERRSVSFPAALADEMAALMIGKSRDDLVFTDLRGGVLRNSNGVRGYSSAPWRRATSPTSRSFRLRRTTYATRPPACRSALGRL